MNLHEYLALALLDHPIQHLKLTNFLADHTEPGPGTPALVLQCGPKGERLDVDDITVRSVLRNGGEGSDNDWGGFQSSHSGVFPVFDGIRSQSASSSPSWVTEIHSDATLVAGLVKFFEQDSKKVLPYFYAEIFADFAAMVKKTMGLLPDATGWSLTATLVAPDAVPFGGASQDQSKLVVSRPSIRPALQWPVYSLQSPADLDEVHASLVRHLLGGARSIGKL